MTLSGDRPAQVVVDDREVGSGIVDELQQIGGVEVTIRRLAVGDYLIDARLLIERKTLSDFVASLTDGRLFRQASKLAATPLRCALILEGIGSDLAGIRLRREAVHGAILTLAIKFGIPLLRSRDPTESARLIVYSAMQLGRPRSRNLLRPGKRPASTPRIQIHILQGLPGIGPERARRLLEAFGCVEKVMTAPADQLARVNGIGIQTARQIRWLTTARFCTDHSPHGFTL